jgi:transcription elongation factor S-II
MLTNALTGDGEMPEGVYKPAEEIAELIEDAIFKNFRSDTSMKYKSSIRSRVFNLKDKKNPALRETVLLGVILPEKLASMTTQDMASDEVSEVYMQYLFYLQAVQVMSLIS